LRVSAETPRQPRPTRRDFPDCDGFQRIGGHATDPNPNADEELARMNRIGKFLTMAMVALIAVPALAVAAKPRSVVQPWATGPQARYASFHWTYPYASRLCALNATGQTPRRLSASSTQLTAACTQLQSSFAAAKTAYLTAANPLHRQALTVIRQYVAICQQDRLNHAPRACRSARQAALVTLSTLRTQARTAAQAYRTAIRQARQTFWTTVRSLRGGTDLKADPAQVPSPPSPIPADSSVPPA
jgi:hypothetical protein